MRRGQKPRRRTLRWHRSRTQWSTPSSHMERCIWVGALVGRPSLRRHAQTASNSGKPHVVRIRQCLHRPARRFACLQGRLGAGRSVASPSHGSSRKPPSACLWSFPLDLFLSDGALTVACGAARHCARHCAVVGALGEGGSRVASKGPPCARTQWAPHALRTCEDRPVPFREAFFSPY